MNSCHHHHHHIQNKQKSMTMNFCQTGHHHQKNTNAHHSSNNNNNDINSEYVHDLVMSNGSNINNNKKFTFNSSSFNQSNRNKFAYRNYLSKPTSSSSNISTSDCTSIFKPTTTTTTIIDAFISKEKNSSIEIFSSLSSSSSSSSGSSSTSSSISPTFSTSICYENNNYAHADFCEPKLVKDFRNESDLKKSDDDEQPHLNHHQTQIKNDMSNFEDLQKAGMILRKALREIKSLKVLQEPLAITNKTNFNSMNTCNSSSSSSNRISAKTNKNNISSNCRSSNDLAFDNLTYFSSNENLKESNLTTTNFSNSSNRINQSNLTQINSDIIKKTLKSIKRKEKMKKNINSNGNNFQTNEHDDENLECKRFLLSQAKSMPDLSMICKEDTRNINININNNKTTSTNAASTNIITCSIDKEISNFEYEKRLRKMYRNKSLSRSLRRAKSVYYRNRRSKSLEDLSIEDRMTYLRDKASCDADATGAATLANLSSSNLRKSRLMMSRNASALSVVAASSCSSIASKMSDISSSYFHDLSDWSPEFSSSESESSDEEIFQNFDWNSNLSNVVFSGFNSSNEEEEEEEESDLDEYNYMLKSGVASKQNDLNSNRMQAKNETSSLSINKSVEGDANEDDILNQISNQADVTANTQIINRMLNEVMSRMLRLHPTLFTENLANNPASNDFISNLKSFPITESLLKENIIKNNCKICMGKLEIDEEVSKLSCEHVFHFSCIQFWLSKSATCPICMKIFSHEFETSTNESRLFIKRETLL